MTTYTLARVFAATAALSLALAPSMAVAQSNLVVNGGFESGDFSGWRRSGNSVFLSVDVSGAQAGNFGLFAGPFGSLAFLSQTLQTVPGTTYQLEYWLANFDAGPNQFSVTWAGKAVGTPLTNAAAFGYQRHTIGGLVATSTTTTITFAFRHDPSFFALDNISVQASEIPRVTDIAMLTATTSDSKQVNFTYSANDLSAGSFVVNVYRSADARYDAGSDVLIGSTTITNPRSGTGSVLTAQPIDPARPFILVVADPANAIEETNENNNLASYRKHALGILTPGAQIVGNLPSPLALPAWVGDMAHALRDRGYAKVVSFDWSAYSNAVLPGQTTAAAILLGNDLRAAIEQLNLSSNDVLDTHWIGHSRGAVVNGQALARLWADGTMPATMARGWMTMTMLDPHPAKNTPTGPLCSFDAQSPTGWLLFTGCAAFQEVTNDPDAVFPARVNLREVYFQQTSHARAPLWERFLNLWGVSDLPNSQDWTHDGIGHAEIPDAYRIGTLEDLSGSALRVSSNNPPPASSAAPNNGDDIDRLFPEYVDNRGVAQSLTTKLALSRTLLSQGNTLAARAALEAFMNEVQAQRGAHITAEAADLFLAAAASSLSAIR